MFMRRVLTHTRRHGGSQQCQSATDVSPSRACAGFMLTKEIKDEELQLGQL